MAVLNYFVVIQFAIWLLMVDAAAQHALPNVSRKRTNIPMGALLTLFGGEEEANGISDHDKVVLELKTQRDNLTKYTKKVHRQ